jgi:hypothetical protein
VHGWTWIVNGMLGFDSDLGKEVGLCF